MKTKGCITALITPFNRENKVDYDTFESLINFQVKNGVTSFVVAGTTGEGPTLTSKEWKRLIEIAVASKAEVIANTGFNSTAKTLDYTEEAYELGCRAMLLVDPYYNGPSSLEIRKEYYEPVAERYADCTIIPYVIPGRTGTQLLPIDLSLLYSAHPNVEAIKDATGSDQYSREVREFCGSSFHILSGDDERTFSMMKDKTIAGDGVISVISNIAPKSVELMVNYLINNDVERAREINEKLKPLFQLVTLKTDEVIEGHKVSLRFRNPVPVKTLASLLGIPAGSCRRPLGKVSRLGLKKLLDTAKSILESSPEVFKPIEESFGVSVEQRLSNPKYTEGLAYE